MKRKKTRRNVKIKQSTKAAKKSKPTKSAKSGSTRKKTQIIKRFTIKEAAHILQKTESEIIEYAIGNHVTIHSVTALGDVMGIPSEDLHRFMVNPHAVMDINDLRKKTYNSFKPEDKYKDKISSGGSDNYEDEYYMPHPQMSLSPPKSDVSIETLRISEEELNRLKKQLQGSSSLNVKKIVRRVRISKNKLKKIIITTRKALEKERPEGFDLETLFQRVSTRTYDKAINPSGKGLTPSTVKTRYYELFPKKKS